VRFPNLIDGNSGPSKETNQCGRFQLGGYFCTTYLFLQCIPPILLKKYHLFIGKISSKKVEIFENIHKSSEINICFNLIKSKKV